MSHVTDQLRSMLAQFKAGEASMPGLYTRYIQQVAAALHRNDPDACPCCGGNLDPVRSEPSLTGDGYEDGGMVWVRDCPECFHQVETERAGARTVKEIKKGREDWPV